VGGHLDERYPASRSEGAVFQPFQRTVSGRYAQGEARRRFAATLMGGFAALVPFATPGNVTAWCRIASVGSRDLAIHGPRRSGVRG
jgi:hypothetical protein